MRRSAKALVGLAGAFVLAGAVGSGSQLAHAGDEGAEDAVVGAARQSFVGEWQLNRTLSDDPRAKMRADRPGGRPEGGRGSWGGRRRGGSPGPGGRGPGGPGPGGEGDPGGSAGPAGAMLLEGDRITITNLKPEITIVAPEGELRTLHADGKGYRTSSGGTVRTRWDGVQLVVETKGERGGMKEVWSVAAAPRRLTVLLELQRPFGGTVRIKRVFDPLQSRPGAPREPAAPATVE